MVEYRHRMTRPLVEGLRKLRRSGGGPINLNEIGLTRNQWDNFQKLKYFGLVMPVMHEGRRRAGVWCITQHGLNFLAGSATVTTHIWTYRGERVRTEGNPIFVWDVFGSYQLWEQWVNEAQPHIDDDDDDDF